MTEFFLRHADISQLVLFALVITTLWVIERAVLAVPHGVQLRHCAVNLAFAATALPVELAVSAVCLKASQFVGTRQLGLVHLLPDATAPWIKGLAVFVALDLCDYVYHRLMHHVPSLWRFHLVHHTDQIVDASTTIREHPGETLVRGSFLVLWTLLLGASFEILLLRQAAETVFAILSHSAVRLPPRLAHVVGWVFVTPNLHHVHHHHELPHTDRNFGGVFTVWDHMFGTFGELEADDTVFGLDTHLDAEMTAHFGALMVMPFDGKTGVTPVASVGSASVLVEA